MLGVDVSKAALHGTWCDPISQQVRWQGAVPNTPAGIRRLLARVPHGSLVLEPTGRYGEPLIRAAQAVGRDVLLAPPRRARSFLAATQPRAKTDRLDSAGLALYGLSGRLRPYRLPEAHIDQVRQLLAARRGLSSALMTLRQQHASLPQAAPALAPALAALEAHRQGLDRQLAAQLRAHPGFAAAARLQAVPGIGPVTAAALVACLTDKQFASADQFVAYVGLDLRVHASGRRAGQFGLSKHGDAELRRLLYLAALAATRARADRTFAERYARERAKGLASTAAVNAVARKLARLAWSLVTHGTAYDPQRVDTQP